MSKKYYRTFVNENPVIVKASSKKVVMKHFGVSEVDFWCKEQPKNRRLHTNMLNAIELE